MSDDENLKKGDDVEWSSHGNKVEGTVVKKVTKETEDKEVGRKIKASKDDPQYVVESDKSGKKAAHKPDALDKK